MSAAKDGDTVKVHYTGRLEDGSEFDSSRQREPIEFKIGDGEILPGVEQAVVGLEPGGTNEVTLPADDAYGPRRDDMIQEIERSVLPQEIEPEVGLQLQAQSPNGQPLLLTITDVGEEKVTVDANHPLAGKDLTFEVELVEVVK
ncbi:peptidylprolyl isomerase [Marivibrio halodurans]|uniref:Peptidyl-prolyl cis-trans isomerase n=1 Tax=Marivibrio halodurans TaxID=2039722 RepID=A0A8J7S268_9PROT|nr:peptidylprolyl isomerase [Marivibrio halodurans]MBP5858977.1 peptidylprolyl isomerase [Marivibrio halodurans]